jgi:para-nitrobenzyl esterase
MSRQRAATIQCSATTLQSRLRGTWRARLYACLLCVTGIGASFSHADEPNLEMARTDNGVLRGVTSGGVVSFRGIPYAAPPLGRLRWAAPAAVKPWKGTRAATEATPPCAQLPNALVTEATSEDCLYLHVTVPYARIIPRLRPVMVWLHGFESGGSPLFDPRRLSIGGDVIVVMVDSRVSILGFYGYPGLVGSGTFGLQDQQAALRWIQRNIAVFGGDTGNVTLFGGAGGALAVCAHMTAPGSKGLFHKAILQSGACTTSFPANTPGLPPQGEYWRELEDLQMDGLKFSGQVGCASADDKDVIECLRKAPLATLLEEGVRFNVPAYGNRVLPTHPGKALLLGEYTPVPVISGFAHNEAHVLASRLQLAGQRITEDNFPKLLNAAFGDRAPQVQERYPLDEYGGPALTWSAIYTDRMFACPQLLTTQALALRVPAYAYEFTDPNSVSLFPLTPTFAAGAVHSGEIPLLFDIVKTGSATDPVNTPSASQRQLARTLGRYWTEFARTGSPNNAGSPRWRVFKADEPYVQAFAPGSNGVARTDAFAEHQCQFWTSFIN